MAIKEPDRKLASMRAIYPEKFPTEERIFRTIHPGNRIFIGTGCGEPQYLVRALINYVQAHPKAFFDAELLQVWTLGVSPYADAKFKDAFRPNSFFIGNNTRDAVNIGKQPIGDDAIVQCRQRLFLELPGRQEFIRMSAVIGECERRLRGGALLRQRIAGMSPINAMNDLLTDMKRNKTNEELVRTLAAG